MQSEILPEIVLRGYRERCVKLEEMGRRHSPGHQFPAEREPALLANM